MSILYVYCLEYKIILLVYYVMGKAYTSYTYLYYKIFNSNENNDGVNIIIFKFSFDMKIM